MVAIVLIKCAVSIEDTLWCIRLEIKIFLTALEGNVSRLSVDKLF